MTRIVLAAAIALSTFSCASASFASIDGVSAQTSTPVTFERSKPRVKGGSGCNSPRDLIEHPECR